METDSKLGEILKANNFGPFPLGNGEPVKFINKRVTLSALFLRKLPLMAT